jgi:ABC-type transporter Mla maintaining outer membrane lipid asymmetry permease subunit MlaE
VSEHLTLFVCALVVIACVAMVAGVVLALSGYSSAGAFSVAAASVGVLGTLAAESRVKR